jgi:dTDP-6-deoxy-L-talose 4-dehydrogenase (NAD+)
VRALAARGMDVVAADRPGARADRLTGCGPRVRIAEVELGTPGAAKALLAAHRPTHLLHLAWYAEPGNYLGSRENLRSLSATTDLVATAVDAGCRRIVAAGSCLEYAASDAPHRESDPAGPESLYAACKHAAHVVCEPLTDGSSALLWARIFYLHGPGEDPRRLMPMVATQLRHGEPVDLSGGEQVRDYLHVADVADALATLACSDAVGVANVCSGMPTSLRTLLGAIGEHLGRPELLRFGRLPYRDGERMCIAGDPGTLRALGWRPRFATPSAALAYLAEDAP